MHPLGELCQRELYFVRAGQSVLEVSRYMAERGIGGVAVLEELPGGSERLAGIFTERDLMMRVVARGADPATTPVTRVMTVNPVVVDEGEAINTCLRIMKQANCRHLPVVSGGRFVGMVSMRDVLAREIADRSEEADMMRSYIHSIPPGTER